MDPKFQYCRDKLYKISVQRAVSTFEKYDFVYRYTKNYRLQTECIKFLVDYSKRFVENHERKMKTNENEDGDDLKYFLDLLINRNNFSDTDIQNHIDSILIAVSKQKRQNMN